MPRSCAGGQHPLLMDGYEWMMVVWMVIRSPGHHSGIMADHTALQLQGTTFPGKQQCFPIVVKRFVISRGITTTSVVVEKKRRVQDDWISQLGYDDTNLPTSTTVLQKNWFVVAGWSMLVRAVVV